MPEPTVVIDDYRYTVTDLVYEGITISKTVLKKNQRTRGHSHEDPELYLFFTDALLIRGNEDIGMGEGQLVHKGSFVPIRSREWHQVQTLHDEEAVFVSVFPGTRETRKALY